MKIIFIFGLVFASLAGCGTGQLDTLAQAESRASQLVGGHATDATRDGDEWLVFVKLGNGATVNVTLAAKNGDFLSVQDVLGPFDYDFSPRAGLLSFKSAEEMVVALQPGDVRAIELADKPAGWIWEFYILDGAGVLHEVKLHAEHGDLLSSEVKDQID